ncbi:MAG TPA: shikimate kinase, partial [Nitrospiraceae bacterium]|nr:shikimate kinase [Nitrospiraceae bacterium]
VISTDAEIVKETGQSIPLIVEQFGWDHFRGLETQMCQKVAGRDNLIIDTGGGLILKEENVRILKENGNIFWLTAEVSTIASRIAGDTQRPSLSGTKSFVEEIEGILEIRRPHYQAAADHVIPTDQASPERIADAILSRIST